MSVPLAYKIAVLVFLENSDGQHLLLLRAKYLVNAQGYNKIQGQPFKVSELEAKIQEITRSQDRVGARK